MDHHGSLKSDRSRGRSRARRIGVVAAGVLLAGAILLWRTNDDRAPLSETKVERELPPEPPRAAVVATTELPQAPAPAAPAAEPAHDPLAGKPHPISPDHVRIEQENTLFRDAAEALAAKDVPELRRIAAEHRAAFPDRNQDMADGYDILADCLQYPGAASTSRARRFFDEETYSMMRRPILRTCLQAQN